VTTAWMTTVRSADQTPSLFGMFSVCCHGALDVHNHHQSDLAFSCHCLTTSQGFVTIWTCVFFCSVTVLLHSLFCKLASGLGNRLDGKSFRVRGLIWGFE